MKWTLTYCSLKPQLRNKCRWSTQLSECYISNFFFIDWTILLITKQNNHYNLGLNFQNLCKQPEYHVVYKQCAVQSIQANHNSSSVESLTEPSKQLVWLSKSKRHASEQTRLSFQIQQKAQPLGLLLLSSELVHALHSSLLPPLSCWLRNIKKGHVRMQKDVALVIYPFNMLCKSIHCWRKCLLISISVRKGHTWADWVMRIYSSHRAKKLAKPNLLQPALIISKLL